MVSVHELSVMALLVSQARPFPVEWKGLACETMALYGIETYCALWVYCRDQEAGGYFRKIFQLADALYLFLEGCFSSSV